MFKNLENVLPPGKHIIKVFVANEYVNGAFVKGTQKRTKPNSRGISGYVYNTDVKYKDDDGKERRVMVFAYDAQKKALLDSGEVQVNIVPKLNKGEPIFKKLPNGNFVQEMTAYINPSPQQPLKDPFEGTEFEKDIPVVEDGEDFD